MRNSFLLMLSILCTCSYVIAKEENTVIFPPLESVSEQPELKNARLNAQDIELYSKIGKGEFSPLPLKKPGEPRITAFETSFEECAPGRNSARNEWSTYGIPDGGRSFNNFGRQMRTRYPIHEVIFRIKDGEKEIMPCDIKDFRLGLMNNRIPAVYGAFSKDRLTYKVTVMCVPDEQGPYDLYKIEIENPTKAAIKSKLLVGVDGPADMRLDGDVVRGQGNTALIIAAQPERTQLVLRDWGLCDKRAKSTTRMAPNTTGVKELSIGRVGFDGVGVTYRMKVERNKKYIVCMTSSLSLASRMNRPVEDGELIFEYKAEGSTPHRYDYIKDLLPKKKPIFARFDDAQDTNGDGFVEVSVGASNESKMKDVCLSLIQVFPANTEIPSNDEVWKGKLNEKCVYNINVGITPEMTMENQDYDMTDVGIGRLNLDYNQTVSAGQTKTYWLKVPPFHRREHAGMQMPYYAFYDRLPGQAIPPYDDNNVVYLRSLDPKSAEKHVMEYWDDFFSKAARFEIPDSILNDMYLSRLATRVIMNIKLADDAYFNACSPWQYFDFSYRDHCYSIRAWDLTGRHDLARQLVSLYCKDVNEVPLGPMAFSERQLKVGMNKEGYWLTRPGQHDTVGQNLWGMVEHYRLTGDRGWFESHAYQYIRRGATWIVNSRHKHMQEVKDSNDIRYGLLEPGAMEVFTFGQGMHDFYTNSWAVLGLHEAAYAAKALNKKEDYEFFHKEYNEFRNSLQRAFRMRFQRSDLYSGAFWFGVEPKGTGIYGFWGHTPILWPCGIFEPHDPMLTATFRHMENRNNNWAGGVHAETRYGVWPYMGVDWGISYILRGEREKTLEYFCSYVDTAGNTLSWGEGLSSQRNVYRGEQPHNWADTLFVAMFRHLFIMEHDSALLVTPSLFRRWHIGTKPVKVHGLSTYFGDFDMTIQPQPSGTQLDYEINISPRGDQGNRELSKIVLYPRTFDGRRIESVNVDGKAWSNFTDDSIIIANPERNKPIKVRVLAKE